MTKYFLGVFVLACISPLILIAMLVVALWEKVRGYEVKID